LTKRGISAAIGLGVTGVGTRKFGITEPFLP
jgi:hypothetical protein